jgi:hypothetical protein
MSPLHLLIVIAFPLCILTVFAKSFPQDKCLCLEKLLSTNCDSEVNCASGDITLDSSLVQIDERAFENGQITGVDFSRCEFLKIIGELSFSNNKISSLNIPASVITIGKGAFWINEITELTIPPSVETIEDGAFSSNLIKTLTIGASVTTIGEFAFVNNKISLLYLSRSVTSIGEGAFHENQLTTLIIPASVKTIGREAFSNNPLISACYEGDRQPSREFPSSYFGINVPFERCSDNEL